MARERAQQREGYIEVPGGRVWYRVVGTRDAVPLLTLHGGPGATSDYFAPLHGLADERPVVFYDQLGGGKSDQPNDDTLWRIERFVEEVAAVRRALDLHQVHHLTTTQPKPSHLSGAGSAPIRYSVQHIASRALLIHAS